MSMASDARFWDRTSRKYAAAAIADQAGYERTLERTIALLRPDHRVLEVGCGTGTTALRLARAVQGYLATDISAEMIAIAEEKHDAGPISALTFRATTAENLASEAKPFNAVLGFNYLHLVRDLPGTLRRIHALLAPEGLFISKTPCVGEMNAVIRLVLLPAMRAVGRAPYVNVFRATELSQQIGAAGFDIVAVESHSAKDKGRRPYVVARKKAAQ